MSGTLYTGKGDDGSTGILGEGRVMKSDPRMEALGAIDEASANLGLARSLAKDGEVKALILHIQRELYQIMAEVAAPPETAARFRSIGPAQVQWLEQQLDAMVKGLPMPKEFIIPGDNPVEASMHIARTMVRRAERKVVHLYEKGLIENNHLMAYLNRLSSFCFVLGVGAVAASGKDHPTLAKVKQE